MTLREGIYCLSRRPDTANITVTVAPQEHGVIVASFGDDGVLLPGSALLIQVIVEVGSVLISALRHSDNEPSPEFDVVLISKPSPTTIVQTKPAVMGHIQNRGDVGTDLGEWLGERDSNLWIEGIGIEPATVPADQIEYQAILGKDWHSPWIDGGKYCGSRGMGLPLLGVVIRLKGEAAEQFVCAYEATFIDGTSAGPVTDGEPCCGPDLAPMESFRVEIRPK